MPIPGFYESSSARRLLQNHQLGSSRQLSAPRLLQTPGAIFRCPPNCELCNSATVCTFCSPGYFMRPDNACYLTCDIRYVGNSISRTCMRCPYDCLNCRLNGQCVDCDAIGDARTLSTSSNRCIPAQEHYESFVQVANKCPTGCLSCFSSGKCGSCVTGFLLNSSLLCSNTCPIRWLPDFTLNLCVNCPYDCLTCTN